MRHVPAPLEWHPAYAGQTWLIEYLQRAGPRQHVLRIARPRTRDAVMVADGEDLVLGPSGIDFFTLKMHRLAGPAPYVGEPFIYTWLALVDELGRAVAGDSWVVHHQPWSWPYAPGGQWPDPYAVPLRA